MRLIAILLFVIAFLLGALVARNPVGAQGRYQIAAAQGMVYILEVSSGRVTACDWTGKPCIDIRP